MHTDLQKIQNYGNPSKDQNGSKNYAPDPVKESDHPKIMLNTKQKSTADQTVISL